MPPDADKLRQRSGAAVGLKSTMVCATPPPETRNAHPAMVARKVAELQPHEVCIDGVVYDLTDFEHPGGESIAVFGGNDVTVQYKMIHPYHTEKHLAKMKRVGKVTDYAPEFKFDTPFERELKSEVFKIVRRGREFGTPGWYFRAIVICSLYFVLQYLWVTTGASWQLAVAYGVIQAMIGLNVQHDANHGAASKRPRVNNLFGLGADLIGGSKWLWLEQHWTHHAFTNHHIKDPDSFGAEPMLLFNDYPAGHPSRKWVHRFQAFFYLPVLAGYWVSSVFNPEVLDLRQRGALGVGIKMDSDYLKHRRKYAIALRLYYIFVHCITPFCDRSADGFQLAWSWEAFGNIMLLGAMESLTLAILFSLSHNFEESERDPLGALNDKGSPSSEPVDWFKAQVETSCTYGGFISGCLTGGLNFQVEHHLFPRMSSAWYPFIAPTVRAVCKKHKVRYVYYPWVWQNLASTLKYIHAAGTGINWKDNPLSGNL